jgi:hemerythrin superfamily protein
MKVTVLLRNDHEALKALFDRFRKPGARKEGGARDLFSEIRREILIHSQMESEIFYPALAATSSAHATELISRATREHRGIERLLTELNTMTGPEKNFESKMNQLIDEVLRHIEMEEEEIFEEARKSLAEYRLEELGLELEDRKKILTSIAA